MQLGGERKMSDWDLLLTDARIATMRGDRPGYGIIEDGAIAIAGGALAWIGERAQLPRHDAVQTRSLAGRWITPALIDCHTHLIFAGDRADEYAQRLHGASYEQIAAGGGGILSTVRATREATDDELFAAALPRVQALIDDGVATIEIKSGYGLDVPNELKMLRVARRLGGAGKVTVRTTLLAAHAVPPEYQNNPDAYVDLVCEQLLPAVADGNLADAVDAYCETIAFSASRVARIFHAAQTFGLPVRLHADQLSDGNGAALAAKFGALSADHLEYASTDGIDAMAQSGTVAVLLPGAYVTLNQAHPPPIDVLREKKVPVCIATDCNPGTSPLCSLTEAMALASRLFGLTPEECLAGVTRHAARALGLEKDRGTLDIGKRADLAIWDIDHPHDLSYWLGTRSLSGLYVAGRDADQASTLA